MTDISIGRALWNGLARQVAVRGYDDAADFFQTVHLKLVRYRVQTSVENVAALRASDASNAFKNVMITKQLEDSVALRGEAVGTRNRVIGTNANSDKLPPRTQQIVRSCPCKRVKRESVNSETK